jgi:23S rRNA pseudouridine2605 synthase
VVDLLEWAGLDVPKTPMKQLSQREKDKATSVFVPKVRKQRGSALDRDPAMRKTRITGENNRPAGRMDAGSQGRGNDVEFKKPESKPNIKRRIRGDLPIAPQVKNRPQKKSDNNRGRG